MDSCYDGILPAVGAAATDRAEAFGERGRGRGVGEVGVVVWGGSGSGSGESGTKGLSAADVSRFCVCYWSGRTVRAKRLDRRIATIDFMLGSGKIENAV